MASTLWWFSPATCVRLLMCSLELNVSSLQKESNSTAAPCCTGGIRERSRYGGSGGAPGACSMGGPRMPSGGPGGGACCIDPEAKGAL